MWSKRTTREVLLVLMGSPPRRRKSKYPKGILCSKESDAPDGKPDNSCLWLKRRWGGTANCGSDLRRVNAWSDLSTSEVGCVVVSLFRHAESALREPQLQYTLVDQRQMLS